MLHLTMNCNIGFWVFRIFQTLKAPVMTFLRAKFRKNLFSRLFTHIYDLFPQSNFHPMVIGWPQLLPTEPSNFGAWKTGN